MRCPNLVLAITGQREAGQFLEDFQDWIRNKGGQDHVLPVAGWPIPQAGWHKTDVGY
jgi:hypothetical protein